MSLCDTLEISVIGVELILGDIRTDVRKLKVTFQDLWLLKTPHITKGHLQVCKKFNSSRILKVTWRYNIKMHLYNISWNGVDSTDPTQVRVNWWTVVKTAMNSRVP
jgi:hypothetical protein